MAQRSVWMTFAKCNLKIVLALAALAVGTLPACGGCGLSLLDAVALAGLAL